MANMDIQFKQAKECLNKYLKLIQNKYVAPYFENRQYSSTEKNRRLRTEKISKFEDLNKITPVD